MFSILNVKNRYFIYRPKSITFILRESILNRTQLLLDYGSNMSFHWSIDVSILSFDTRAHTLSVHCCNNSGTETALSDICN
jgi:hypothetical protein